jgi:hypothetical protein
MERVLDEDGLRSLCAQLGISFDDLPGKGKSAKLQSLVRTIEGNDRACEILQMLYRITLQHAGDRIPEEYRARTQQIIEMSPEALKEMLLPKVNAHFACTYAYTVYGSGDVVVDVHVVPGPDLPPLPRIGLTMALPGGYERFTWYGRGPHESYVDRKVGAQVGVYGGTVDEQYVPYVVPQENGNKTDVRWVSLRQEDGVGLLAVGMPTLEVSAHHYTAQDLATARHTHELTRGEAITLNLDHAQSGLGGASCGPGTLDKYRIQPEEVRFSLRLRGLRGGASETGMARRRIEPAGH